MRGDDMKAAREAMGLTAQEFGRRLGLTGSTANVVDYVRGMENGQREISGPIGRLTMALLDGFDCPGEEFWPAIIDDERMGRRV